MTAVPEFDRARAEIPRDIVLPHAVELPVLGVPVRFESNSVDLLAMVEEAFGVWRSLDVSPTLIAPPGARLRFIVHDGKEGGAVHAPVTYHQCDGDRHILRTTGSVGIVDGKRREAAAWVTRALLADWTRARYVWIEGMTLTLASARNRFPVHAAGVARGSNALLLAGPPGTGKSTLAYQSHRAGLRVLSDDAVYVQVEPVLRLWGVPGRVNLLSTARAHFPELAGLAPSLLEDGSEKMAVRLPNAWAAPDGASPVATRAGVCLLERSGGRARLARVPAVEVRAFLKDGLGISRFRFGDALDRALEQLVPAGGWRLSLADDPSEAAPFLEEMLGQVERQA